MRDLRGEGFTTIADVAHRCDVEALVAACLEMGGIDVMVANAGVSLSRPFLDVTEEELEATLAVNLKGVFFCGQAAARAMRDLGRPGSIINVASTLADVAIPDCSVYSASKGGVRMLTKAMALELGQYGIRVNAVAPGYIRTGMNPLDDPEKNRSLEQAIPLRRIGSPEDVADAMCWLASDGARYVSGEMLFVDGGWIVQ